MRAAAADLEFEEAGRLRDEIRGLRRTSWGYRMERGVRDSGRSNEGKPGAGRAGSGGRERRSGGGSAWNFFAVVLAISFEGDWPWQSQPHAMSMTKTMHI